MACAGCQPRMAGAAEWAIGEHAEGCSPNPPGVVATRTVYGHTPGQDRCAGCCERRLVCGDVQILCAHGGNPVAAIGLGLIERAVGTLQQTFQSFVIRVQHGHANADSE